MGGTGPQPCGFDSCRGRGQPCDLPLAACSRGRTHQAGRFRSNLGRALKRPPAAQRCPYGLRGLADEASLVVTCRRARGKARARRAVLSVSRFALPGGKSETSASSACLTSGRSACRRFRRPDDDELVRDLAGRCVARRTPSRLRGPCGLRGEDPEPDELDRDERVLYRGTRRRSPLPERRDHSSISLRSVRRPTDPGFRR
jgi:hypothetical protein